MRRPKRDGLVQVYRNTIKDCLYAGIKIEEEPQGVICGNTIEPPDDVDEEDVSPGSRGG